MDHNKVLAAFRPLLDDSIARLHRRTSPNANDVQRIFGPVFECLGQYVGVRCAPVPAWNPADVTDTAVREAV